jgi:hypothetical protein
VYDIQVRSVVAGEEMSAPFALAGTVTPGSGGGTGGTGDTTAPVLTATPAFNGTTAVIADARTLTLSADEGTIYYTVDGSAVTTQPDGNVPSATAKIYSGTPIPITADNTAVKVAVIDAAGNATHSSGVVSPKAAAAAVAPTGLQILGTAGAGPDTANPQGRISAGWNAVPDATEYKVRVYDRNDATATNTLLAQYDKVVTGTNGEVTGLPKSATGHRYVIRVQAKTPAAATYGPLSLGVNAVVTGDDIGVEVAQYRAGDELRIRGTGTVPGSVITVHRPNAAGTGPVTTAIAGYPTATVGALDAGLNTGPWEIVLDPAPATNPGTLWFKSSNGDVFGPVTVEAR